MGDINWKVVGVPHTGEHKTDLKNQQQLPSLSTPPEWRRDGRGLGRSIKIVKPFLLDKHIINPNHTFLLSWKEWPTPRPVPNQVLPQGSSSFVLGLGPSGPRVCLGSPYESRFRKSFPTDPSTSLKWDTEVRTSDRQREGCAYPKGKILVRDGTSKTSVYRRQGNLKLNTHWICSTKGRSPRGIKTKESRSQGWQWTNRVIKGQV